MSHLPLPATAAVDLVRGCEEAGMRGDSFVCLGVFLYIWGLVDTGTTVALGLGGEEPTFNPQRVVTRMTIQSEEVLRPALW